VLNYKVRGQLVSESILNKIDETAKSELEGTITDELREKELKPKARPQQKQQTPELQNTEETTEELPNIEELGNIEGETTGNIEGTTEGNIETPEDYTLSQAADQLAGIVDHWFRFTQKLKPEQKDAFLKLGDRLSELYDVLRTEFLG